MSERSETRATVAEGRPRAVLCTGALGIAAALATPAGAQDLARYTNVRFAITALVPADLHRQPPPANGDGATFAGPAGEMVLVFGGWDGFGGLGQDMAQRRGGLAEITYEAAGEGWHVVSGYDGSGAIVYHKAIAGENCRGQSVIGHVEMRYPQADRGTYDPLVKPIADSLAFAPC